MITAAASSPSLPTNPLMSVAESSVAVNPAVISGVTPTEGFSNALTSQINLLGQPTADISTLTPPPASAITSTILTAITNPDAKKSPVMNPEIGNPHVTSEQVAPQANVVSSQILIPPKNLPAMPSEMAMSATDTAILSSVNDTLKFISSGSKLGDTLPAGQMVQLPTTNSSASPLTQQSVQTAVQQAVSNTQVTTPATVLAQQVTPVQISETTQIENHVAQKTVTPEKPVTAAQAAVPQAVTSEKPVEMAQATIPQAVTLEKPIETAQAVVQAIVAPEKPEVVQQAVTPEKPVETAQAAIPQAVTPEKPIETVQAVVQAMVAPEKTVETAQAVVQQSVTVKTDKKSDVKTESKVQTEPVLMTETAAPIIFPTPEITVKVEKVKSDAPKSENQTASTPVIAQQAAPEMVAPLVTAQAAPAQVETLKATFDTTTQATTPDEKQTLTPAKNLLMEAVANRNNANGNSTNSNNGGNTPSNPTLQTENVANLVADNKTGVTDTKSFASVLTAEKSDVISAATVDKSTPQNVSAAVNKLVQDTKIDVPAMTRPLTHPAWNQELGSRIVWMNNQGISSAEIKMNPQNMGPITVRIDMNQDQATINFTAQNSDVRTALEASIPKLREMLSSQNVNLADVNVAQQSSTSTNSDSNRQQQTAQMMADASANGQGNRQQNNSEVDAQGNIIPQANVNSDGTAIDQFANGHILETNGTNGLLSVFA